MKPRTSRPRSPTSARTITSAAVPRVIMPSSVLLPTPLPPNRPRRWPRPHVSSASIARTPVASGVATLSRCIGFIGGGCSGTRSVVRSGRSSSGRPSASTTRPSSCGPTSTAIAPLRAMMRSPGRIPETSPSGTVSSTPSRKPTTCTGSAGPESEMMSQTSPTRARGPCDSISRPTTRSTRPWSGIVSARSTASR